MILVSAWWNTPNRSASAVARSGAVPYCTNSDLYGIPIFYFLRYDCTVKTFRNADLSTHLRRRIVLCRLNASASSIIVLTTAYGNSLQGAARRTLIYIAFGGR